MHRAAIQTFPQNIIWCNAALCWNNLNHVELQVVCCLKKGHCFVSYLMEEGHSSVHVGSLFLVVTGGFHHVLRVTEQSQVHQLVIKAVLLFGHNTHVPNPSAQRVNTTNNNL